MLCCSRNPSPSSLQDLWALPAVSLGWSVFDPQIRTSSQSSKPFPWLWTAPVGAEKAAGTQVMAESALCPCS